MGNQIKKLQQSAIEQISKIIGDTSEGLTGSELGQLLTEKRIADIDPHNTKWKRLYSALLNDHNNTQCSNGTLNFIIHVMRPDRYLNDIERFNNRRRQLNEVLSFEGFHITERGGLAKTEQAQTISEAKQRADNFNARLHLLNVHKMIFIYCKEELLTENYFHSVLEAAKSIFDRVGELSMQQGDGAQLVDAVFMGANPILIINNFTTDSEHSEQKGFANFLKGVYGMFRNPIAHSPKIKWSINEDDAIEAMTIISYCHKVLDQVHKIR